MTVTVREAGRRQRLSWAILSGTFVVFCLIAVAVPVLANAYLQNATEELDVMVQANQGTVGINDTAGNLRAVLVGEPSLSAEEGSRVRTDNNATAVVLVSPPDQQETLARLQVYSNTSFDVDLSAAPQFELSDNPRELMLYLETGRLRLSIPAQSGRPLVATVRTPHGSALLRQPGQYVLAITNTESQVTVQEGRVELVSRMGSLLLTSDQRGFIPTGGAPVGPLDTERNLIENGDFTTDLTGWEQFAWNVELTEQPEGETQTTAVAGEPALLFTRQGLGHADASVRQRIDVDVTDYSSLRLLLTFRVVFQSLGVCGVNGSECPLFVRVNYVDQDGVSRSWRQGFYAFGQVVSGQTPDACTTCVGAIAQRSHERVPLNQVVFYEVDLRNELAQLGYSPPRLLEEVSLEASGHSFTVEILDLSLIVDLNGLVVE